MTVSMPNKAHMMFQGALYILTAGMFILAPTTTHAANDNAKKTFPKSVIISAGSDVMTLGHFEDKTQDNTIVQYFTVDTLAQSGNVIIDPTEYQHGTKEVQNRIVISTGDGAVINLPGNSDDKSLEEQVVMSSEELLGLRSEDSEIFEFEEYEFVPDYGNEIVIRHDNILEKLESKSANNELHEFSSHV